MPGSLADAMKEAQRSRPCCASCVFWNSLGEKQTRGACHRFPPQVIPPVHTQTPPNANANWQPRPEHYFPMSMRDQWCGEFEEARD